MTDHKKALEAAARAMFDVTPFRENSGAYEDQSDEYRRLCRAYARAAITAYLAALQPTREAVRTKDGVTTITIDGVPVAAPCCIGGCQYHLLTSGAAQES